MGVDRGGRELKDCEGGGRSAINNNPLSSAKSAASSGKTLADTNGVFLIVSCTVILSHQKITMTAEDQDII